MPCAGAFSLLESVDRPIKPGMQSVKFQRLADAVIDDYIANERSSVRDLKQRFEDHILPVFGRCKGTDIDTLATRSI